MNAAAVAASVRRSAASPNDTIRVAAVGVRGRGKSHIAAFTGMKNVELAALCDIDESVLRDRVAGVEQQGKKRPAAFTDFRRMLEDKSIDAVSIATQNHNHTLQTVWACQAGKDVYVEKPCSHNVHEARQIVAAARKYDRIVQHGTQGRSGGFREAAQAMREGAIGDVYMARGVCYKWRNPIGKAKPEAIPAGVHYDMWVGPAPMKPFTRNRFHYNWHWQWDYGNGEIGNQGIHQLDIARWGLGVAYPTKVFSTGGRYLFDDDQQTPSTQIATFEFGGPRPRLLVFEVRHWITNDEAGIAEGRAKDAIGNIFLGSKGYLAVGGGIKMYIGKEREPSPVQFGGGVDHYANFIAAMRSRKRSDLNAEIEEGAISTVLLHLANTSYRLGRPLYFNDKTMQCTGDEEANRMLTRIYRAPYIVPEKV